jgi:hypothetical protein
MTHASAHAASTPHHPRAAVATPQMLDALADAIASERRLIEELVGIMRRQRGAVTADDLEAVDDSVYATHRVLLTLNEARRRRRSINRLICNDDELALRQLEALLGGHLPAGIQQARDALRQAAETLAQEVEINRKVLRSALAAGDDYVRSLVGADQAVAYPVTAQADRPAGGVLLDRRA